MSTNYFARWDVGTFKEEDPLTPIVTKVHIYKELHIGKSSWGWCFSLHYIPSLKLTSWEEWKKFLEDKEIYNEDEEIVSLEYLEAQVTERQGSYKRNEEYKEAIKSNKAARGPNRLLRHVIDGKLCVGHGDGTYDLLIDWFR